MKLHFRVLVILLLEAGLVQRSPAQMPASGEHNRSSGTSADCGDDAYWDFSKGMCQMLSMEGMPMSHAMWHANIFLAGVKTGGRRGRGAVVSPNMAMGDFGRSLGDRHFLNLDLMLTAEKWTLPPGGYPLLLQIGEENAEGRPYIDAQHPHSSPIMGLTISDTFRWGRSRDHLTVFFAPRGQATEGPTAFMHRVTGEVNPDAPLGHHVGQDVSHITSTVLGVSLALGATTFEASTYHGREPEPDAVDLPLGAFNSAGVRVIEEFSPDWAAMASWAYISSPEKEETSIDHITRYSASLYTHQNLTPAWDFHNALIYGGVRGYDETTSLHSFGEEFLFDGDGPKFWGRVEVLQRSGAEIDPAAKGSDHVGHWITSGTLGYSHRVLAFEDSRIEAGASFTNDFLPQVFQGLYGAGDPWSGKIFLRWSGMGMFSAM